MEYDRKRGEMKEKRASTRWRCTRDNRHGADRQSQELLDDCLTGDSRTIRRLFLTLSPPLPPSITSRCKAWAYIFDLASPVLESLFSLVHLSLLVSWSLWLRGPISPIDRWPRRIDDQKKGEKNKRRRRRIEMGTELIFPKLFLEALIFLFFQHTRHFQLRKV